MINLDFKYLILGFVIGIFAVYITQSKPKVIVKYPTPENAGKVTYIDDSGVCYKYKSAQVSCPINIPKNEIPIQA